MMSFRRRAAKSKRGGTTVPTAAPERGFIVAEVVRRRHSTHRRGANPAVLRVEGPALFPGSRLKVETEPVSDTLRLRVVVFRRQAVKHLIRRVQFVVAWLVAFYGTTSRVSKIEDVASIREYGMRHVVFQR